MMRRLDAFAKWAVTGAAALVLVLLAPRAGAVVAPLNAWANVHSSMPNNLSGTVTSGALTVSAGTQRLFVVAVVLEVGTANATLSAFSATFGGVAMHPVATTAARSSREHAGVWYLLQSEIPAGAQTISASYTLSANTVTGIHVDWAAYEGVDQATPINSSAQNASAAATVTFGTAVNYVLDGLTFYATGNGGSPTTVTPPATFTTLAGTTTSGHSSFIGQSGVHAAAGSYAGTTTVTFGGTTSTRSALVAVSLRPGSNNGTAAGSVSVTASGCNALAVSAPYTGDADGDNTLSYRYRTPSGTGAWQGPFTRPHSASPYSFNITGLSFGSAYDVEVTYVDPDGVSGTNPQTVSGVMVGVNCTGAGAASAAEVPGATPSLAISAPYTFDNDADNTLSYRYRTPSGTGAWSAPVSLPHSASPYAFTLAGLVCGATYDVEVTYNDADGIGSGTQVQTLGPLLLSACTSAGSVTATGSACGSISVSAPYSRDTDGDNSLSYRYRTPSGTGAWVGPTAVAHAASPYAVSITGLAAGSYDVEVTYVDPDGVGGTNPQTVTGISVTAACTTTAAAGASVASCTRIDVSAPFSGDSDNDGTTRVEYNTINGWPGTDACAAVSGASPRTCAVTGLADATTYWIRVSFSDPDGVVGANPQVLGPFTTQQCRVTPQAPSAAADACNQVTVSAPFAGDADGDSRTDVRRGSAPGGPFPTAVCLALAGASPRACIDNGVAASTTYYYQVTFTDPDGVTGNAVQVTPAVTTPACSVANTTAGTLSAFASACNALTASVTFSGDEDNDGSTLIEYNTSNTWPGTVACAAASGASPRQCTLSGLAAGTTYWLRATFSDPDGVAGTNPTAAISIATLAACGADSMPPTLTVLVPARNAIVSGADTAKVQVYDAGGLAASNPVQFQIDGSAPAGFSAAGVTLNPNHNCGTKCGVYDIALPARPAGAHYLAVRATDAAGNAALVTWAFRVQPSGAGTLLRRTTGSQLCLDCHNLQTHNSQYTSTAYGNWAVDCATCHVPHGTRSIFLVRPTIDTPRSGVRSVDFRNRSGVAAYSYATPAVSPNPPSPPGVCEVCHTRTKNSDATPRARNNAWTDWSKHFTGRCTGCHPHGKGFAAGESEGGATCAGCHQTIWDGMTGAVAKTSRHALGSVIGVNDAFNDVDLTWSNPLSGNAAAVRSCVNMCHNDHPHTLSSPVVDTHENNVYMDAASQVSRAAATRTSADKHRTDFEAAAANGGLCLSCHRNPVDASHPAVDKAAFAASAHDYTDFAAFGAWRYTLHDGSAFERNCTKCHADRGDGGPGSGTFPFGAVHFSDFPSLLGGSVRPNNAPATYVCYNCHGNGTLGVDNSGKNIASQVLKTRNHPSHSDNVHDSVAEFAASTFGAGLGAGVARHANCLDCHDPHEAQPGGHSYTTGVATFTVGSNVVTGSGTAWSSFYVGARIKPNAQATWFTVASVNSPTQVTLTANFTGTTATGAAYTMVRMTQLAGPALQGAFGAQLSSNPAFWAVPAAGNFTKKLIAAGTDVEATLCFKCHSAYYGALPNAPSGGPQTDQAREFNPANVGNFAGTWAAGETAGGFHPVLAAAGSNLGAINLANLVTTNLPWSTTTRNLMACTDCHESDSATDPNGPHGSTANYLLRGPNTGWAATTTMGASGMPAGTFCANCHSATFASSRFSQHYSRSDHRVACWNCHAAVPHGGPRPGMLIAPAGANANVGGTIAGWDTTTPYWGLGASTAKLYLVSYPANNTTGWAQGNCGCNGTGH